MLIISALGYALLPIAATFGWFAGGKHQQKNPNQRASKLHHDYFRGLNYLIDEQPDKAVDVFVKLIEVDDDTVEMHLALGNLFRRRGEVDRAIRIHQNLIARPYLEKDYRFQALAALGQDYLRAGVLDRAERLFQELLASGGANQQSLRLLLRIYQQEKDWRNAIQIAEKLAQLTSKSMNHVIAQFHCELAQQHVEQGDIKQALSELDYAQKRDSHCARVNLIRAQLAKQSQQYSKAIACYQQVIEQDPDFVSEAVEPLCHCYQQLGKEQQLVDYLIKCLREHPRISLAIAYSNYLQKGDDYNKNAIEFVTQQIQREPSLRGLIHLSGLYLANSSGDTKDKLLMLQDFMQALLADKPVYRCTQCGFSSKTLFWLCPSCHSWSTIKPIHGIEGS